MSLINYEFRNSLIEDNRTLTYCYQCSTCSGGCPVALQTAGKYNPRKIIEMSLLGFDDELIEHQEPNVWLCSTCQTCVELCPQEVNLTEIFTIIKNKCFERGLVPEAFFLQGAAVLENGIAIPYSNAILSRREKLGLPEIATASTEEVQKILNITSFSKNLRANEEKQEGGVTK